MFRLWHFGRLASSNRCGFLPLHACGRLPSELLSQPTGFQAKMRISVTSSGRVSSLENPVGRKINANHVMPFCMMVA